MSEEINISEIINEAAMIDIPADPVPQIIPFEGSTTEKKKSKKKRKHSELPKESLGESNEIESELKDAKSKNGKKKKTKENKEEDNQTATNNSANVTQEIKKKKAKKEEKSKVKGGADTEQRNQVLDYMIMQNRPYSIINIFDNLHGNVKKKQLERILDSLSEEGELICKEYNSKIYLAAQHHFPEIDQEQSKKLDDEIEETREQIAKLKEKNACLMNDLKFCNSTLTDEELEKKINIINEEVQKLQSNLNKWREGKIEKIPDELVNTTEKEYEKIKTFYKKTKKICNGMLDTFCEGMEMNKEELLKYLRNFETDTDLYARLNNKNL